MLTWIVQRSKVFFIIFFMFVIVGVYTFSTLPQREIPEISFNIGTVTTVYPGATVADVERDITNPIESSLSSVDGIEEITSSSAAGISNIVITIEEGENKNQVLSDIRQAVAEASASFPDNVQSPNVNEVSGSTPIVSYHLVSEERSELHHLHDEMTRWKNEVEKLTGVERVTVKGVSSSELLLSFDSQLLGEARIAIPDVISAIEEEFQPTPLGKHTVNEEIVQLKVDNYRDITDVENIFLRQDSDGKPIYIKDVGTVSLQPKKTEDIITIEGKPSISFTAFVKAGEDIPTVDTRVEEKVMELSHALPDTVEIVPYYSQASLVTEIFKGLFLSLAIAVGAVILTASLGLTISGAIAVALAVPTSVLMGLIPLPLAGVDLNQISIIGIIIALGILVDDSIVVNDNIERHFRMGATRMKGVVDGVREIWVSIVTSTLAIVFTFLPLVFLSGGNGAFIRALPTVLITTILASTIVALILVPILRFSIGKRNVKSEKSSPGLLGKPLDLLSNIYADKLLKKASRRPLLISVIGLILTTATLGLAALTPFEFFPAADREEVTIDVTLPIGTTLEDTYETLENITEFLSGDEGVKETSIFAGTGLPNLFNSSLDISGDYTGQIVVRVDRKNQTAQGFIEHWTGPLREEFTDAVIFLETIEQGPPSGAPVTVTITGPALEELLAVRDNLQTKMMGIGAELVLDNIGSPEPTYVYVPIRESLEENGVTINQISEQIRLITDGIPFRTFDDGTKSIDSRIVVDEVVEGNPLDLQEIEIVIPQQGPPLMVPLNELVSMEEAEELQRIPHLNGERSIVLRAFPGDVEDFKSKVTEIVEEERETFTNGEYSILLGGENTDQENFFAEIIVLFIIVILLVYVLIAFQFNSLSMPFLVLVAVYLAIAGAILGLFVTQTPISFLAVMGMVSLTGIVVRNSIVLIDFMEKGRQKGMAVTESVVESGRARLRPIVLTAITSIVALIPIAASGDALFAPLAVTIISGILFSTILTLLIIPMLYIVFVQYMKKEKVTS
ncbi:efflux RND transporter permease subunit [Evansella sp. AB-rgal1]|uniref:efflux RND transporter permease subunit n=1 Tax=Evansella sp. AB-rgal1 TaxID=3242696 RepID=UPI00359E00F2